MADLRFTLQVETPMNSRRLSSLLSITPSCNLMTHLSTSKSPIPNDDLQGTLEALQAGETSVEVVLERADAIARSAACRYVYKPVGLDSAPTRPAVTSGAHWGA